MVLTKTSAPWAYSKGEPFRTIAALELLGALFAFMLFKEGAAWLQGSAYLSLTGYTDNSGNTFLLDRLMTSKYPLVVILIEVAEQLAAENVGLALRWIPRLQNEEADALTNGCFESFAPERRIEARVEDMRFLALNELMSKVGLLMAEITRRKQALEFSMPASSSQNSKKQKLRETDPW